MGSEMCIRDSDTSVLQRCIIQFDMIQSFKMVFDANRISTQKIREIIEELTELGVYDSKTGMVSYDNDDKVLEQKIIAILDNIVQNH